MAKLGFLILCGGKSSRMGQCKALLNVDGKTMLDIVSQAGEGFEEKILSVNDPAIPTPDGYLRCADMYPGNGPAAGLHAALSMTTCDALIAAPCDAPFYSAALAQYLAEQFDEDLDALILLDSTGRAQPLMGVYSKRLAGLLEESIMNGHCKLMRILESVKTKQITLPAHMDERVFSNVNTPEEYAKLKAGEL